jgi:tetratricopeptide (TPR) repeat protein
LLLGIIRRTVAYGRDRNRWTADLRWLAPVVVGLWLHHPIQTEAVNYIVQRTELIAAACCLGTLYAAVRAWDASSRASLMRWRGVAILLCLVGMGSKEVAVVTPLLILLYDRAFRLDSWYELASDRARLAFYLLLAATTTWAIALIAVNSRFDTVGFGLGITWYQYLYSQAWAIAHYLRLVAWPDQLTFDYGQHPIAGIRGVPGLILLAAFGLATIVAWTRVNRWGWFAFLGAWFFVTLAPSSSFVPITTEIAAERRIYLALASVLVLIAVAADAAWRSRATKTNSRLRIAGIAAIGAFYLVVSGWKSNHVASDQHWLAWAVRIAMAAGAMLFASVLIRDRRRRAVVGAIGILLLGATAARSLTYTNPESLWRDTVLKAPTNPRALDNLAFNLFFEDPPRLAEAKELYWQAIALDSTYLHAWPGLASIAVDEGKPDEAIWLLERALTINPNYADAVDHLGKLYLKLGRPDRAIQYLSRFAASYPGDTSYIAAGRAYMAIGRLDEAAAAFRNALRLNPLRSDAAEYLGGLLAEQGRGADAVPLLEQAASNERASGVLFGLLSLAYAEVGRPDDASRAASTAVQRANGDPNAFVLSGRAMLLAKRVADANAYLSQAVELGPSNPEAVTELGHAKAALGDRAAAVALFRRALTLDSTYAPARDALRAQR